LIEQTPTKICFPNPDATMEDYATDAGLNLTEREYRLIKQDIPTRFAHVLGETGHNAVVAKLDLKRLRCGAFGAFRPQGEHRAACSGCSIKYGEDAHRWLPHFSTERVTVAVDLTK